MKFRRTVATELTLLLSIITTVIAIAIGCVYYSIAAHAVKEELMTEAGRTADELSQILVSPLFNFDQTAAQRIAQVFLRSGRVKGIAIHAEGMAEVFNNLSTVSSSIPVVSRPVVEGEYHLGTVDMLFNDALIVEAKNRAIRTTLISVACILLLYSLSFSLLLRHILVKPLTGLGERLQKLVDGSFSGRLQPLPQQDLNTIVRAANRMFAEIEQQTKTLRESERNYREIYNATSDAIFIHAEDGSILDVNQAMLEMYGYTREELFSLPIRELKGESPYSYKESTVMIRKALYEGPQLFKWKARHKDGHSFWVEVSLKKATLGEQQVFLALVRDISQRDQLEKQLRQAQRMEAIGTLAGGIAHDFNNILSAILGYTELSLIQADKSSKIYPRLQQVERASLRARELVRQILTFSRKEDPQRELQRLDAAVIEAMHLIRSLIPVTVQIVQHLDSTAVVDVNASQIHQVIMNLCTNGYQGMPDAEGTLTVSLRDIDISPETRPDGFTLAAGKYVVLTIADDGEGMEPDVLSKIFEPYYTTREKEKGTGLGLSVVRGIIRKYDGQILVSSIPGAGTTFQIFLPVSTKIPEETVETLEPVPGACQKVMVVDDEESVRHLMKDILIHAGYKVAFFADGVSAWNVLSASPDGWDLLITDLTMPGMNGVELSRKVKKLRPNLPIILCTGYNEIQNRCEKDDQIADVCLQKPVTIKELLSTTANVLLDAQKG